MKLLKRLLNFTLITIVLFCLIGLACFGLAAFFSLVPLLGQFLAALLVGWIAWSETRPDDIDL